MLVANRLLIGSPGVTVPPADNCIQQARRNEAKGYDSIWWPDHLMGWIPNSVWTPELFPLAGAIRSPHLFLEPTTAIAAAAAATDRIVLGTAVTDPIRRHPTVLAQTLATLDHISKGRVILGVGTGEAENIVPYGLPYDNLADRLAEGVEVIRLLWESGGRSVNYAGRFWRLSGAVFDLPPYGQTYPPIWIAAHRRRTLEVTGRLGDGWLPTYLSLHEYKKQWAVVERAAREAGRDPDKIARAMWTLLLIDQDLEECERLLLSPFVKAMALVAPADLFEEIGSEHPLGRKFHGFRDYVPNRLSREEALSAFARVPQEVCQRVVLHGNPEEVIRRLEAYGEAGLQHIVLWNCTFSCDVAKLASSFRCMDQVLNHFKTIDRSA